MGNVARFLVVAIIFTLGTSSFAAQFFRWTYQEQTDASLVAVISELNRRSGYQFSSKDFAQVENRHLAFSHYTRLMQIKHGFPVESASLRIWRSGDRKKIIQIEANVENPNRDVSTSSISIASSARAQARVKHTIASFPRTHGKITNIKQTRVWRGQQLVEIATVTTNRGAIKLVIDATSGVLIDKIFTPHPSSDVNTEFSVDTRAYPIYEEHNGTLLEPVTTQLKYLNSNIRLPVSDPYAAMRNQHFFYRKHDLFRAMKPEGRAQGYWSFQWLNAEMSRHANMIASTPNSFDGKGLFLDGRYANVSVHPQAQSSFGPFSFESQISEHVIYDWRLSPLANDWEVIPLLTYRGKPWLSSSTLTNPTIVRDAQHDPRTYIENGFDQIQVYYAITAMFDALRPMGFIDPDLSERPFNAFLYYPDLEWKDNAFYTNDTINFTTYSANELNMARDNPTIWHELGHGVMDRLMGQDLELNDTGGLSEGMADFIGLLNIEATTNGAPFLGSNDLRIINNTGFFLTNEVHDDGEAYGGVMKEILDTAIARFGRQGLAKVTDLILEAMRLSRDHPHLTADDWFVRVRFADELGRSGVREPNELRAIIDDALINRNYGNETERAQFSLRYNGQEIVAGSEGSRDNDIAVTLASNETAQFPLTLNVTDGSSTKLKYPVTVKVSYRTGPLQGALNWVDEDRGPYVTTVNGPNEEVTLPLAINGTCDSVNRDDGTCSDFAYVQIFENGEQRPIGKKRFYVRLTTR